MTAHPDNVIFHAFNKIAKQQRPSKFDQFLSDAGITREFWNELDPAGRRAYWRLFGPEKVTNSAGEIDYDGDEGRNWRDERDGF